MTTYKQIIYDGGDKVLVDMAKKAQKLNTARSINVTDADGTHTGTAASFDGSGDVNIKLPATIKATLVGNADTATSAGHQTTADSATSAGHATSADSATTAGSATSAGTAASASEAGKLSTARSIKTNLASGTAASFDGSADVTPGVTGVLPIANGGTGSNTQNFVDLSSNQIISGFKQFLQLHSRMSSTYTPFQNATVPILSGYDNADQFIFSLAKYSDPGATITFIYNYDGNNDWIRLQLMRTQSNEAKIILAKYLAGVYAETVIQVL